MRIRVVVSVLSAVVIALAAATSAAAQASVPKNPIPTSPDSVAAGQKVYQRYCRVCHGAEGKGGARLEEGPAASNLIDATWEHGSQDGQIFTVIKTGVPPEMVMAAWEEQLSDTDIWNLVNYIRSLAPMKP